MAQDLLGHARVVDDDGVRGKFHRHLFDGEGVVQDVLSQVLEISADLVRHLEGVQRRIVGKMLPLQAGIFRPALL